MGRNFSRCDFHLYIRILSYINPKLAYAALGLRDSVHCQRGPLFSRTGWIGQDYRQNSERETTRSEKVDCAIKHKFYVYSSVWCFWLIALGKSEVETTILEELEATAIETTSTVDAKEEEIEACDVQPTVLFITNYRDFRYHHMRTIKS